MSLINKNSSNSVAVTVMVLAYNNIHLTKQCIDSLFKYTDTIDYELITINNGSKDGTLEYFNSLPNTKKISFSENLGVDSAYNYAINMAEGKYTLNLSNDIIVTKNWLNNMIACMENDNRVGMVVPTCTHSSNIQQVNLNYDTIDKMQIEAAKFNISNPLLWEERMRLVTYTCLFRTDLLQSIGGFDKDFDPGGYDDDAISFRIRRAGYKLMLAADTFVHHFGSATFNVEYTKNNLAQRNKQLFEKKFVVCSWSASKIDFGIVKSVDYNIKYDKINILGIGSSCGSSLLQIKNTYRKYNKLDVSLFYATNKEETILDLQTICDDCVYSKSSNAKGLFTPKVFNVIVLELAPIDIKNLEEFYSDVCSLLDTNGQLITTSEQHMLPVIKTILETKGLQLKNTVDDYYYMFK